MKTHSTTNALKYLIALFISVICFQSSAQENYYWVGGTGNWSDYENHWATSSGGTEFHTTTPTDVDDVYFDENSFTAEGQVVTLDIEGYTDNRIHTMDWRGSTNTPSLVTQDGTNNYLRIHGSLYFQEDMNVDVTQLAIQIYDGDAEFASNGVDLTSTDIYFFTSLGTSLSLSDSLSAKAFSTGNAIQGTFTSNGNPIHTTEEFNIDDNIIGSLDISNSTIYTKSFGFYSNVIGGVLSAYGLSVNIIYNDGVTNADRTISNYNIHVDHLIAFRSPRFGNLTVKPGTELSIDDFIDRVIFDELTAEGTLDEPVRINGHYSGQAATLFNNGGEANISYVILQDIEGSGASINAYYSLDNGNVTGFNFIRNDQEIAAEIESKDYEDIGSVYVPSISATSGLDVTLESSNVDVAEVINGNELLIQGIGTTTITANQSGNIEYNPAESVSVELEVTKADQSISFEIPDTWIGDVFINLGASSSSALDVSYHVDGGNATIENDVLTFTGTGTVQIRASQAGNDNYNAAEDQVVSFEVYKKAQTITFDEIEDISEDAGFVNLDAMSDSGLPVTYSVVGPGEVVDGAMEFTGNGMVQVTAKQAGNDLYLEADMVRRSFEIIASTTEKPLFLTQPEGLGSIYPNPVADYLHFDPQLNIETIKVTDLSGKVFYEGAPENDRLSVSSFEIGTYIFSIKTKKGEEIVARIVKN